MYVYIIMFLFLVDDTAEGEQINNNIEPTAEYHTCCSIYIHTLSIIYNFYIVEKQNMKNQKSFIYN